MSNSVLQTVPLGSQWPTLDPFLFCAHHHDDYPPANESFGPAASLDGRQIGSDFAQIDGWNMYHGSSVPGFPQHPHRGFETVTFVRRGVVDHSDSLGAAGRFGQGDAQWMTAGSGVVHSEMFPLLDAEGPNPLQLFQIWLNLPAADKFVDAHFTMLWGDDIPKLAQSDSDGLRTTVTMVAGALGDTQAPQPPPNSWAARPEADIAIWHIAMEGGASWELPPAVGPDTLRTLYLFEGPQLHIDNEEIGSSTGAVVDASVPLALRAGPEPVEFMMLQGRPIGEPVAQYGPFVMNTEAEIRAAFDDYNRTEFGGWPWPSNDPVHLEAKGRFAKHADGRVEERGPLHPAQPSPESN